ncbi:hypothetical protein Tco_0038300 [Tanacetum coccineum]
MSVIHFSFCEVLGLEFSSIDNMEEAWPSVTEKPTIGSVHLHLDLENDDDDMMIDVPSVRDLDQPPEVSHKRQWGVELWDSGEGDGKYTLKGRGGESFWEGGDDLGVDGLCFHTCLTDILGFLEKLEWWFEQDIDEEEVRFEGDEDGDEV